MSLTTTTVAMADVAVTSSQAAESAPTGITAVQWKSGAAAWLGWMFDGLDMHLYTLVAMPFVAELLSVDTKHPDVGRYGSWIQAAFLVGWALGGTVFGWLGDRLGRSRTLVLTILTYAAFTGLSYLAQTWQLMALRFLAALGIGREWAVGAALLAETWPARWRPWLAAVLQTGVNIGVMLAGLAVFLLAAWPPRTVFLLGYRTTLVLMFLCYFAAMMATYGVARDHVAAFWWLAAMGVSSGSLALFSMYLPPLFPTLLRTTGAGFCFNIGRVAAAAGTVFFGAFAGVGDLRLALLYAGIVFLPAALLALLLPELRGSVKP